MERALRAFFDQSQEGMYVTTRDGNFIETNHSFCALLGYSKEELIRLPVESTLAHPMERRRFRFEVENNGAVSGFKINLLTKAGEEVSCSIDAVVLRDDAGEVDGFMGIVRKLKAPALRTHPGEPQPDPFVLAIRGSNDGLWDWDLKKNEVNYSSRWKALLGYASIELSKSINEWFDRIHPEDMASVKQSINSYLKSETPFFSAYFRMKNKAGDLQWVLARGVGEFEASGKCLRLAGSFSNITSHIKVMEKLKAQEEKLSQMAAGLTSDKASLSRYFSGDMVAAILAGADSKIGESLGNAAILQVHINKTQGAWSRIGTKNYSTFLNEVIVDLMDLVYGNRGSVNKILGDTLLVSFGCPLSEEDDLNRALACAKEMLTYLGTYNDVRPEFLRQPLSLSIGLSWGEVFSATLGSVHRLEYTLIGSPVSRAEVLQKTAEKLGQSLLVDDRVAEALGSLVPFRDVPGGTKGIFML